MTKKYFQNAVKEHLDQRGFYPTKSQLEKLGISQTKFTRIYNKSAEPTIDEAMILAEWLDVPVESIFIKKNEKTNPFLRHKLTKPQ